MADVRQRKKKAVTATAQGGSDKKQSQKKAAKQAGGGGVGAAKLVSIALALVLLGALAFVVLSPTTTTPPPSTTPSTAPPKPQQQQQQQQQPAGAHEEPAATPEPASETQKGSDGGEEDALSFVQRMKVATSKKVAEELQQPDDNQEEQDVKEQGKQPASSPHDPAVPFAAHPQIEFDIEGPNDHAVPGALSKVISPLSLVNLFYTYTDEHPFHIKRVDDYYAGLNSNLSHIDLLLQIHAATAHDEELLSPETNKTQANCAFVKHGMGSLNDKYPDAYHAYLDGCTIVCNIVPAYWQPLAGLMHGVQQETGLAYMANMYLTPRASQGFVEHTDNKDGLIVQTDGRKEWVLKNTKFPMPLRHQAVHMHVLRGSRWLVDRGSGLRARLRRTRRRSPC
ncbi:hypothetical protein PTSG_07795 [Salpingoeca rosetta]|uniref:JmjC domain-containing protein n=1 Tax=Salpingoeca rosetta (strain ATCC 50818 / BSB-021) TaxID=946362 RepID=F2UGC6_SALR5|nr:uncharacterized protein PTSG_07795 [Salpingoeca rosetta]EGD75676.1 hypothetical protein PTSG_07795 [Salpingoeca rosetta]|eukprot:XP_004991597.1 hypothetical protein PTSG_07795 [Salpingoeca rosetta]